MAYKITGKVVCVGNPVTLTSKTGRTYTKRDLVIAVRKFDQYTGQPEDDPSDTPKFTFMEDRAQALSNLAAGDVVTVSFEVSGREFTNKEGQRDWFTDIRPVYVGKVNASSQPMHAPFQQPADPQPQSVPSITVDPAMPFGAPVPKQPSQTPISKNDLPF